MKYIVFNEGGLEDIVIFSKLINHSDMAKRVGGKVLGAGFVRVFVADHVTQEIVCECYGESISLGISSRPEDTGVLSRLMEL